MTRKPPVIWTRNYRGIWFRNGKYTQRVPFRVLELARTLPIECRVELRP